MVIFKFDDLFEKKQNGLKPKMILNCNSVIAEPDWVFKKGDFFGGVNFYEYENYDIEGEELDNIIIIKGFIKK